MAAPAPAYERHNVSTPRDLDFIYIGQPKSGSTWLFEALRTHSEVRLLPSKSSKYFETDERLDLDPYRELLGKLKPGGLVGEISHDSYMYASTAERLYEAFPKVKIIVCLREPGAFAQSVLQWWSTHTKKFGDTPEEMREHPHFRAAMDYEGGLKRYFDRFPAEQIKVVFFDQLKSDPVGFYASICDFLGVGKEKSVEELTRVVNKARPPRIPSITRTIYGAGDVFRRAGLGNFVEAVKRSDAVQTVLYASERPVENSIIEAAAAEREALGARLDQLEAMLPTKLPPQWRQAS